MPRCLPPTAVPFRIRDLVAGCRALCCGSEAAQVHFRAEFGRAFEVKHVFLSSSGKAALVQLLLAMAQLRPGKNEVLLPAYTSFSVPSAVVKAGLKVSLYDLDPKTLSPDLASLTQAVNSATLCVIVCHLYGYPADLTAVQAAIQPFDIFLIDDAAQALGARYQGRLVGTLGDAGLFSLGRGKPLSAGEGGIAVTNSDELAAALEAIPLAPLRWHQPWLLALKALALSLLQRPGWYWIPRKLPFLKLGESVFTPSFPVQACSGLQAVLGQRMLHRSEELNQARRALACCLTERLPTDWQARMIRPIAGAEPIYLRLPIVAEQLLPKPELGIVTSYPLPLSAIAELQPALSRQGGIYPGASRLAAQLRTLPTHGFVTSSDLENVVAAVAATAVTTGTRGEQ